MKGALLTGPLSKVMDKYNLHDPFIRKWFDYLAFALSGLDAGHTQAAPVAYMMIDLHMEGALLDYPKEFTSGMEKHAGQLHLISRVEQFLLQDNVTGAAECKGVS